MSIDGGNRRPAQRSCATLIAGTLVIVVMLLPVPTVGQPYGRLDTSFDLTLRDRRTAPYGTELDIQSTTVYPCAGYRILSSVVWSHDTLSVTVLGLRRPTPCVPLTSVATGSLYLGQLGDTTVVFRFLYRGHEDRYRVVFVGGTMKITPIASGFTSLRR